MPHHRGLLESAAIIPNLSPSPKPVAHSSPSLRMGGLQANSGGVSRARALPLAQVREPAAAWQAFMLRDNRSCSKNRRPEATVVSFLIYQRRKPPRGLPTVPWAKSIRRIDFRWAGHEGYARMAQVCPEAQRAVRR